MFEFKTSGTCATRIFFDFDNGKVHNIQFENGCNGNLKAIGKLVEGMEANAVIEKLSGIQCGSKPTSCGDQLARAVKKALEHSEKVTV
ncbi:MAG: TIGR03905 family TSCPD domain-containing protein [Termitinemataceae bacterium]|nr:MAG: TIGR03905 family TSCPD domain-containing protein [Termitinemataceae bacterium]